MAVSGFISLKHESMRKVKACGERMRKESTCIIEPSEVTQCSNQNLGLKGNFTYFSSAWKNKFDGFFKLSNLSY